MRDSGCRLSVTGLVCDNYLGRLPTSFHMHACMHAPTKSWSTTWTASHLNDVSSTAFPFDIRSRISGAGLSVYQPGSQHCTWTCSLPSRKNRYVGPSSQKICVHIKYVIASTWEHKKCWHILMMHVWTLTCTVFVRVVLCMFRSCD